MRPGRALVAPLLLVAACNQVFGLDGVVALVDAPITPPLDADSDRDDDGVDNDVDNCPDAADPAQHDEDGDGVGDVCDPCPLDPDTVGDADEDGIDDTCDPHPQAAVDCLRLFDSFASFATSDWDTAPGSQLDAGVDEVRLRIASGARTGIAPVGITGPSTMRVRFAAVTMGSELRLSGRSDPSNTDDGYQCRIEAGVVTLVGVLNGAPPSISYANPLVPGAPMLATIIHDVEASPPTFGCHAAPPFAFALPFSAPIQAGVQGNRPMIVGLGTGTDLTVAAVAIYGPRAGDCTPPIIR